MSYWTGKKVLVTGGGGFIGGHLTEGLQQAGAEVTCFLRYTSQSSLGSLALMPAEARRALRIVHGDLKDPDAVRRAVAGQDVVFHAAALIGIPYSYVHPMDYVQTNVVGTTNVLDACRGVWAARLVSFSTSEVYGTARYVPIDEEHPLQGQSPYSASKIAADQLALSYHRAFGLGVSLARPFNTYGPRQPSRAVIPTIIAQALKGQAIKLGSLTPTRDLLYVSDTVRGVMRIAEETATIGEVVNLGTGREIAIGDLARLILGKFGMSFDPQLDKERLRPGKSEVERLLASTEKAKRLLAWESDVSLDDGIERTIAWMRDNLGYYRVDGYHV